jgi:long-chain acyl-CoA synthetase
MTFKLATILRESARTTEDRLLLLASDRAFSHGKVDEIFCCVASSLLALGFRPEHTVAVQLPNVPQLVFAYFGILNTGLAMSSSTRCSRRARYTRRPRSERWI